MAYDDNNIFAKILRGEIPCKKIYEDRHVLAFHDISPQAPVHALIVPKGKYTDAGDFSQNADDEEIVGFYRSIGRVRDHLEVKQNGYRLICNTGEHGMQEVPHFHMHILGGKKLGKLISDS